MRADTPGYAVAPSTLVVGLAEAVGIKLGRVDRNLKIAGFSHNYHMTKILHYLSFYNILLNTNGLYIT